MQKIIILLTIFSQFILEYLSLEKEFQPEKKSNIYLGIFIY